ncbi:MAG: hypothetical protein KDD92_11060 [Caldilineaceae bacterium]|nr:hypothetical protein [Caldilineaceae bacterium]
MTDSFDSLHAHRPHVFPRRFWRKLGLVGALLLYLGLTLHQLGLPGLHYDEAKEAGINAMELLTGAPVTAFRGASLHVAGVDLPLMVQDYIGALNVYLALPFLALTGIGVPNLRILSVLTGLAALLLLERTVSVWMTWPGKTPAEEAAPISREGVIAVLLLAASPSFVFWSRQGIFVTNLTQPLTLLCLWQGLVWLQGGRPRALWLSALAGGLALYAKLLAIWIIAPFTLLAGGWWILARRRGNATAPPLTGGQFLGALAAFLLPLTPLLLFNLQTGGTLNSIGGNLGESYYGVNNLDIGRNLAVRMTQLGQTLRGDHLWYLGGIYANMVAVRLAVLAVISGLLRRPKRLLPPLALTVAAVGMSLFTISDLFITHYALLQPLLIGVVALGFGAWFEPLPAPAVERALRWSGGGLIALWLLLDLSASLAYHRVLTRTGGLADHSDASYHLAYYLQYQGLGAPIALDWGMEAPIRYLSQGAVRPIEIFGYASPNAPDAEFKARLELFLPNSDNVYLLRAPDQTVFNGRREGFVESSTSRELYPVLEERFRQRDGVALFEIWRVTGSSDTQ